MGQTPLRPSQTRWLSTAVALGENTAQAQSNQMAAHSGAGSDIAQAQSHQIQSNVIKTMILVSDVKRHQTFEIETKRLGLRPRPRQLFLGRDLQNILRFIIRLS